MIMTYADIVFATSLAFLVSFTANNRRVFYFAAIWLLTAAAIIAGHHIADLRPV